MPRPFATLLAAALTVLVLFPAAAAADDDDKRNDRSKFPCLAEKVVKFDGTIVEAAVSNPSFSTLVFALQAAGLVDALNGKGPFTVFAPTDAAFAGLPAFLLNAAVADPQGLLTSILTYHVARGRYDPRTKFVPREIRSLQGQGLFLSASRRSAGVNQSNVSCQGIRAKNGIVWVIDSVLLPQFPPAN